MDAAKPAVTCYVGTTEGPTHGLALELTPDFLDLLERASAFLRDNDLLESIETKAFGARTTWLSREEYRIIGTNATVYGDGSFRVTGADRDAHQDDARVSSDNLDLAEVRHRYDMAVARGESHFILYEDLKYGSDYLDMALVATHAGRLLARKAEGVMADMVREAPVRAPRPGL